MLLNTNGTKSFTNEQNEVVTRLKSLIGEWDPQCVF